LWTGREPVGLTLLSSLTLAKLKALPKVAEKKRYFISFIAFQKTSFKDFSASVNVDNKRGKK